MFNIWVLIFKILYMAGLKHEEWESWDSKNLPELEKQAEANVNVLMCRLWEFWLDKIVLDSYKTKLWNWKRAHTAYQQKAETRIIFELQRDLAALEFFVTEWFLPQLNKISFGPQQNVFLQIQRIMQDQTLPTDLQPVFPEMILDAIRAIETDWHEPPAQEMQDAQQYFASRAAQSVSSTFTYKN